MPKAMGGAGGHAVPTSVRRESPGSSSTGPRCGRNHQDGAGRSRVAPGHAPRRPIGRNDYAQSWPCSVAIASSVVAAV